MMRSALILLLSLVLASCVQQQTRKPTLGDIDIRGDDNNRVSVFVKPESELQVREAYARYLRNADKSDRSRLDAITRLAELELEMNEKMAREQDNLATGDRQNQDEKLYDERLNKTIELLETSIRDYPKAKNNDRLLYQLAKVYAQKADQQSSIGALQRLVRDFPRSPYYIEAQFRLGEYYFAQRDYINAEDAYTEVIASRRSAVFYEKALFKRGWSRFKQELYLEAADDFLQAVSYHDFQPLAQLNSSEREQFDEYFRAIGLAFSYMGGAEPLQSYFSTDPNFRYVYHTYATVSDIYLKQERYSDAVDTLQQYIRTYPEAEQIPYADLKIIGIWKDSGFQKHIFATIDEFYSKYRPASPYWKNSADPQIAKDLEKALREYLLLVASHYHHEYQNKHGQTSFQQARKWYQRYLDDYSSQARQDQVFYLYAELLYQHGDLQSAFNYYQQAAYDNNIILNKDAAYATITISDRLYADKKRKDRAQWLERHIRYALLYSQLYPQDERSPQIILHASGLAYDARQYDKSIALTNLIPDSAQPAMLRQATAMKAQAFFASAQYADAETLYQSLAKNTATGKQAEQYREQLALSIYKQAELAEKQGDVEGAIRHYSRAGLAAPGTQVAATALYDGIALAIKQQKWNNAIELSQRFQNQYPKHKLSVDVSRKLSVAYLNADRGIDAAREFEKISGSEKDRDVKMAALWQAAEIYENKQQLDSALRTYQEYTETFRKPFPQYVEALHKLVAINQQLGHHAAANKWRNNIITADRRVSKSTRTERTRYLASLSSLELARQKYAEYQRYRLVKPLKTNLKKKKVAMQAAVKLFGQSSVYGIQETSTEATFSIARIYGDFSRALLDSERPDNLNDEEREQYEILLEDQAFPFEEKAIEFHETNLARIKDGIYNDWIKQSFERLKLLFPVRYNRTPQSDAYVNVFN